MLKTSDELKDRIEAKSLELQSKFAELKADTRHEAIKARDTMKAKLDELETFLKEGWDKDTEATRAKLNSWLDKDATETSSKS